MGARRWSFPEVERDPEPSLWLGFVLGHLSTLVLAGAGIFEVMRRGADLPWR